VSREIEVLVPGRPSCDLIFSELASWPAVGREVYAGGLGVAAGGHFNTAAALSRLGVRVALVATVGDDAWGEIVLREVRAEGLPEQYVQVLPSTPTPVSVALNLAGDRGFVTYGPGWDDAEAAVVAETRSLLERGAVEHVHGDLSKATAGLLAAARAVGTTYSVDAHEAGPWLASTAVQEVAAAVDVLFANEDEALAMTGAGDWRSALSELAARTPHVVLKRGENGAACATGGRLFESPARPAVAVDATGAGDCFAAGYLWALRGGRSPDGCLDAGNACGAAAVSVVGGYRGALRESDLR
jgi:sugar/nucleoside kinase (ribokinase family)